MRSLNRRFYDPIAVYTGLKEVIFIKIILKVNLSIIESDKPENLCWKREMILFQ